MGYESFSPCLQDITLIASFFPVILLFRMHEAFQFYLNLMFIVQIPELDFEIPPEAQRGSLSTVCH